MPSCHFAIRTLLRRKPRPHTTTSSTAAAAAFLPTCTCWPSLPRSYSTPKPPPPATGTRRDDGLHTHASSSAIDLSTSDSSYLDFLLGPQEGPSASTEKTIAQNSAMSSSHARSRGARLRHIKHYPRQPTAKRPIARPPPIIRPFVLQRWRAIKRLSGSVASRRKTRAARRMSEKRLRRKSRRSDRWKSRRSSVSWRRELLRFGYSLRPKDPETTTDNDAYSLTMPPETILYVDQVYAEMAQNSPSDAQTAGAASLKVGNTDQKFRLLWPFMLLWFLNHDPDRALDFLHITSSNRPPREALEWGLWGTGRHYRSKHDHGRLLRLWGFYKDYKKREPWLHVHNTFYIAVLTVTDVPHLLEVFEHLKSKPMVSHVNWRTWGRLAMALANKDLCDHALDALLRSKQAGADTSGVPFLSTCSVILRRSLRLPGGMRVCIRIVERLTEIGVPLNSHLSAIIMLNAVDAGDVSTAFSIYHSLHEHGLRGDAYHFAALLKACKADIDNAEMLNEVIRAAISNINVSEAPVVATEILHCLALHHTKHNPETAYRTVTDAFAQLFDVSPVYRLGILPEKQSPPLSTDQKRQLPPPQAMYVLLATFLEQAFLRTSSTGIARDLWQRVKDVTNQGMEPFATMAQTDHLFNAILVHLIRTKKGLIAAADVMKYMQEPSAPDAKYKRCVPTVQTWSIFLHGFSRHGQMELAEQVHGYMRKKGIEPDRVTYNILIGGYAAEQDVENVMNNIRRMEADGNSWDTFTLGNAKRLRRAARSRLDPDVLQRINGGRSLSDAYLDFTSDLKAGIGEKLQRVEQPHITVRQSDDTRYEPEWHVT